MSRLAGELPRAHPIDVGDSGEIRNLAGASPAAGSQSERARLDDEASLAPQQIPRDPALLVLNQLLGEHLTSDNLAWRGDPVAIMRSLQKMLVAHSLTLPEEQRAPALGAIRTVELAVRWRLRWMQMRRSDAESTFIEPQQEQHETQTTE